MANLHQIKSAFMTQTSNITAFWSVYVPRALDAASPRILAKMEKVAVVLAH